MRSKKLKRVMRPLREWIRANDLVDAPPSVVVSLVHLSAPHLQREADTLFLLWMMYGSGKRRRWRGLLQSDPNPSGASR